MKTLPWQAYPRAAQLSTIRLDYDAINDLSNAVYQKLTTDPGFVTVDAKDIYWTETGKGHNADDKGIFAAYDTNVPGARTLNKNADNFFSGPLFSFSYKDAAILPDGSRADVILTYSNLHIALQRTLVGDYKCQTYICSGNMLRAGNSYPNPSSNNSRNGLQVDVNIRVADRFGNTVDGSFMYPMSDIDVSRATVGSFGTLYNASRYQNYSESISVDSGFIGNIYVPDVYGIVDEDKVCKNISQVGFRGYKCAVENYGLGARFTGLGSSDPDPGTCYSGFVAIAENNIAVDERIGKLIYRTDIDAYIYLFPNNNYDHKIHVAWKPITQDLRVIKHIKGEDNDSRYDFTLKLTEGADYDLPQNLNYVKSDGTRGTVAVSDTIDFSLKAEESVTFLSIPQGTGYEIKELTPPNGWVLGSYDNAVGTLTGGDSSYIEQYCNATATQRAAMRWTKDDTVYNAGTSIPLSASAIFDGVSVSYGSATISQRTDFNVLWSEDGVNYYYDNSHTPDDATAELACTDAAVTNLKLQSLTLKKEVTGPTDDLGSKWDFTLHIPCLKGMTVTAKLNGNDKTLEFDGNGTAAVRMGHNDLLIIDSLPCSSEYTITENTDPLYTQGYSINGSDMIPGNSTGKQAINGDTIIKFTNDSAVSPPTGLFTSSAPWLIMLMIAAALLWLLNRMRSVDTLDP